MQPSLNDVDLRGCSTGVKEGTNHPSDEVKSESCLVIIRLLTVPVPAVTYCPGFPAFALAGIDLCGHIHRIYARSATSEFHVALIPLSTMVASPQAIETPLTKLFKIKHPVMLAGAPSSLVHTVRSTN